MKNVSYLSGIHIFCIAATPANATTERIACQFHRPCLEATVCVPDAVALAFTIDRTQFAPPHDPKEPPRNKVTHVSVTHAALGADTFKAEPILMVDGTRGFWAHLDGVDHLMTLRQDGRSTYATTGPIPPMTGHCEIVR